ncbi:hypothetical protein SAMN05216584_11162 [Selenomonas sp. WCT3]|uniref:hypothetical protein n=1 Tax=Selenomonas sp. WCT3 TaxID=3158785 RepID=UPI0008848FFC|nr:hypothetical protein SAMN05216584_11162 [Selenomonas ruminantium]
MKKGLMAGFAAVALLIGGSTAGLFSMSKAEAAMVSEVYGAQCWHGDSGYPIWDSGVNMGSIFEVKTARVKYEDERYLKIFVQGSGVCYVHNRYEGDMHTYILLEDKSTGAVTVDGFYPPIPRLFNPAYALVKDYAKSIPNKTKPDDLKIKYKVLSNGSDRSMKGLQGNWYDSAGNLVLSINGHYINGCKVVAYLGCGDASGYRIQEADGYRDIGLMPEHMNAMDFLIFNEKQTLRHSEEPQYTESIAGLYLGMSQKDLEALYGSPTRKEKRNVGPSDTFPQDVWYYEDVFKVRFLGDMISSITFYHPEELVYDKSGFPCTTPMAKLREIYKDKNHNPFVELEHKENIVLQDGQLQLTSYIPL